MTSDFHDHLHVPQSDIVTKQPRTLEEIRRSCKNIAPIFNQAWQDRETLNAEPVLIPGYESGYGLPIKIGMRETTTGIIVGLFEDRSELGDEPKIETIGKLILVKINNRLQCHIDLLTTPSLPSAEWLNQDIFFRNFVENRGIDINGISIGATTTYGKKRQAAFTRMGTTEQDWRQGASSTEWPIPKRHYQLAHSREGLGTLLLDVANLLANKTGYNGIDFLTCNEKSQGLIKKSGYPIIKASLTRPLNRNSTDMDYEIGVVR